MPQRSPMPQPADAPLRPRLVLGWSLFYLFVFAGIYFALRYGRSVPVLFDVLVA